MGVDRNDYIVYGWKLPYEIQNAKGKVDLWAEKFRPYTEGHTGIEHTIIRDGMSGEYTVFGKLIAMADEYEGWQFTQIKVEKNSEEDEKLRLKFLELFETGIEENPQILIFSHFS